MTTDQRVYHIMTTKLPESVSVSWRHIVITDMRKAFISHRNYLVHSKEGSRAYGAYLNECVFLLKLIKLKSIVLYEQE